MSITTLSNPLYSRIIQQSFTSTCEILGRVEEDDGAGGLLTTERSSGTYPCAIAPISAPKVQEQLGKVITSQAYTVLISPDTAVSEQNALIIDGKTYNIIGIGNYPSQSFIKRIYCVLR